MKLYYAETFNPRKACAVARYLGLPVEYIKVDLAKGEHKSPWFLAINPNGRVPALQDGDLTLWEADAIMCHLSARASAQLGTLRADAQSGASRVGAQLWPTDAASQVEVVRWLSWDACHFRPHGGSLYFEHVIKPMFGMGGPDMKAVEASTNNFKTSAAVLDAHLTERKFALGDTLSVADFTLSAVLPWAEEAKLPLEDFPAIRQWHERLQAIPAWREPFADALPSRA